MRAIKFRSWDLNEDEYRSWEQMNRVHYNQEFYDGWLEKYGEPFREGILKGLKLNSFTDTGVILEQWAGLYDSLGVEIYEGDIVTGNMVGEVIWDGLAEIIEVPEMVVLYVAPSFWGFEHKVGKVRYKDGTFGKVHVNKHDGRVYLSDIVDDLEHYRKVIGNIHETPEILKAREEDRLEYERSNHGVIS